MIIDLLLGLSILGYMVWTVFTIYFAVIAKEIPGSKFWGRLIIYHGRAWMIMLCATAVLTMALIMANFISAALNIQMMAR